MKSWLVWVDDASGTTTHQFRTREAARSFVRSVKNNIFLKDSWYVSDVVRYA